MVLKAEFRMSEDQALRVMMTAHRRGVCVVAVYTREVAESKATNATPALPQEAGIGREGEELSLSFRGGRMALMASRSG
jgi:hypothetical protein